MKKIGIIGVGKLGLCFALSLEKAGFKVYGVDIEQNYIDSLNNKTLKSSEPFVMEYLQESKNFSASTDIKHIEDCETVFLLVATPTVSSTNRYSNSQIEKALVNLVSLGVNEKRKHLVICCTVMPKTTNFYQELLKDYGWDVSYNPEFIAQGTIIQNQENPDLVLIGEATKERGAELVEIYKKLCKNTPVFCRMTPLSAEITKIGLNSFLTTKIAFANMIGDLAKEVGAEPEKILEAIGSDTRVGKKFLKYGYGYGGPCLPRDNRALTAFADELGITISLPRTVDAENRNHTSRQKDYLMKHASKAIPIVFNTITYKPNSNILEESQKYDIAFSLANNGFRVIVQETPEIIEELKDLHRNLFEFETLSKPSKKGI